MIITYYNRIRWFFFNAIDWLSRDVVGSKETLKPIPVYTMFILLRCIYLYLSCALLPRNPVQTVAY